MLLTVVARDLVVEQLLLMHCPSLLDVGTVKVKGLCTLPKEELRVTQLPSQNEHVRFHDLLAKLPILLAFDVLYILLLENRLAPSSVRVVVELLVSKELMNDVLHLHHFTLLSLKVRRLDLGNCGLFDVKVIRDCQLLHYITLRAIRGMILA